MTSLTNRSARALMEPTPTRVLRLVRDHDEISRTEIAQLCHLSKPTVSSIVNRLIRDGYLKTVGESASTGRGGRKRELLCFNPSAGCAIAVDIRMTQSVVAVTDLNAQIVERRVIEYSRGSSPSEVLPLVVQTIAELLAGKSGVSRHCVGIGIGLPGLIDPLNGVVRVADTLAGWQGVQLRSVFEDRFGLPFHVENDVKARALAEHIFGAGKATQDLVLVWVGTGIGAGLIIGGRLHRGITHSAGEIGYNELPGGGSLREQFPLLYDAQSDFGDILSDTVLIGQFAKATGRDCASIDSIVAAGLLGDGVAQALFAEAARLLSIVCINLVNTLNPELIILGGRLLGADTGVLALVQTHVRRDLLSAPAEAVRIVATRFDADGVLIGAAAMVVSDLMVPQRTLRRTRPVHAQMSFHT